MKLLFVGGTSFVGRTVRRVAAGHDVTVFHRGRTNDDLLAARSATATATAAPRTTARRTTGCGDRVCLVRARPHSRAVAGRRPLRAHLVDLGLRGRSITTSEDSPLHGDLADPRRGRDQRDVRALRRCATPGDASARSHRRDPADVRRRAARPDRSLHYWARRMAGGDVAVIGTGAPLQIVDARDLGAFIVRCAETSASPGVRRRRSVGAGGGVPRRDHAAGVEARLVDIGRGLAAAESSLRCAGTSCRCCPASRRRSPS